MLPNDSRFSKPELSLLYESKRDFLFTVVSFPAISLRKSAIASSVSNIKLELIAVFIPFSISLLSIF